MVALISHALMFFFFRCEGVVKAVDWEANVVLVVTHNPTHRVVRLSQDIDDVALCWQVQRMMRSLEDKKIWPDHYVVWVSWNVAGVASHTHKGHPIEIGSYVQPGYYLRRMVEAK